MSERVLYPSWRYHASHPARIVQDAAADRLLGDGWSNTPDPTASVPVSAEVAVHEAVRLGSTPTRGIDELAIEDAARVARAQAWWGMTAGSGTATSEMKLVLIRIIDKVWEHLPMVTPTHFVDGFPSEVAAPDHWVVAALGGFVKEGADSFKEEQLGLSNKRPFCAASTNILDAELTNSGRPAASSCGLIGESSRWGQDL